MRKRIPAIAFAAALLIAALAGCNAGGSGDGPDKQVDLAAFAKTLQEKYEFASYLTEMTPEYEYFEEDMKHTLPGLLDLDLEQRVLLVTLISINNGEIDLIQAKNAGDAAKAAEIFQARIDYMAGDGENPGGAFYPGPTQLWTNCSQVVTKGNYVMLVCGEDYEQIADDFSALFEQV